MSTRQTLAAPEPACPKKMVYGPCGGVRDDDSCEVDERPCPFALDDSVVPWPAAATRDRPTSSLLAAVERGSAVVADLTLRPFDREALADTVRRLTPSCDALLVGEHQNRPDFPPTLMAALVRAAGGRPWLTLACRDRNRIVLERELMALLRGGADGVLCVTGDARAPGTKPNVTQVFDLDGTRLAALAADAGHAVAVAESPSARPHAMRPLRLVQKQNAGAHLAILNHVGEPTSVAAFVEAARTAGLAIPVIAAVAVYTDDRSADVLQHFPGLHLDAKKVRAVLGAPDPRRAGIEAAVLEARALLAIDGVQGVNLSGLATDDGAEAGADIKAEIAYRIKEGAA